MMDPNGMEFAESKYHEGRNLMENGEYANGQTCFETALQIFKKNLSITRTADTNYNLGRCLLEQRNYQDGRYHFEAALVIYRKELAQDDIQLAHTNYNLARCLMEQSKFNEAQDYFAIALEIYVKTPNGLQVPHSKYNLGRCFNGQGFCDEAEKYYLDSLEDYEKQLGQSDLIVADTKYNLGEFFFSIGKIKVAEKFFNDAQEIFIYKLGPDNQRVINTQNVLKRCFGAPGAEMENVSEYKDPKMARPPIFIHETNPARGHEVSTVSIPLTTSIEESNPSNYPQNYEKEKSLVYIMNHSEYNSHNLVDGERAKYDPGAREGSDQDITSLKMTFAKFNVTIKDRHDQTKEQIMNIARQEARTDYSGFDFVIYIIITHGGEHNVLTAKDKEYNLEGDFMDLLLQNKTWDGVSKVFIIQACRGAREADTTPTRKNKHNDILLLFSTYKGYATFRWPDRTEFIQELCKQIDNYGNSMDMMSIMLEVTNNVAKTSPTPEQRSTLRNKLYVGKVPIIIS